MTAALDYAKNRAKKIWDSSRSRSPLAGLLRLIGASKVVTGVWICEYAGSDLNTAVFTGKPKQIWRYDANGFELVEQLPELDKSTAASITPVIHFCVDETSRRMICQEWHGLRVAPAFIMVLEDNGKWFVETLAPKS
jgi:hypothetical protein